MTDVLRVELARRPRALRLHASPAGAGGAPAPARAPGRAAELFALRQQADQDRADRQALLSCLEQVAEGLAGIPGLVGRNLEQVAAMVTELGLAVAREVVGAAVDQGLVDTTAVVLRCLSSAVDGTGAGNMKIQLAPEDLSHVLAQLAEHPEIRQQVAEVEFVPNPSLCRGSAQVDSGSGRLLYDPQEVLRRIADEIRREIAGGAA